MEKLWKPAPIWNLKHLIIKVPYKTSSTEGLKIAIKSVKCLRDEPFITSCGGGGDIYFGDVLVGGGENKMT